MSTDVTPIFRKKFDGRSKKRQWEDRRSDKGAGLYPSKIQCDDSGTPFVRVKLRKYAMLLGYSGVDYLGMQRNPGTKTIEEDLCHALLKTGLVTQGNFEQMQNIQFQRAARTDKGVSAARQIVSLKLPEHVDVSKINEHLGENIRVFGVKRVTKGFNSKTNCDARTYMYMLPTISLAKRNPDVALSQEKFRLSEDEFKEINEILSNYVGTKNFHNFTAKKYFSDPSAKRFITSFVCEPPFIRKGVEFAVLKVKGQSFMLHQIRKMVGLLIAIIKEDATIDIFSKVWTQEKVNIPRAPGLGLVLDQVHYERYDKRYGTDGMHETLEWKEYDEEVNAFKESHIYPIIIDTEVNEESLIGWVESKLTLHNFDKSESDLKDSDDEQSSDEGGEEEKDTEESVETDTNKSDVLSV